MRIDLKILESDQAISQKILTALKPELERIFRKSIAGIQSDIRKALEVALRQEPEYRQLVSGYLKIELGLEDAESVESIITQLADTTKARILPISIYGNSLQGGIIIEAIQSDNISNIIYSDKAYVYDRSGYVLPWLEWLLLMGNSVLVKGYDVKYGPYPSSRSGGGIMVRSGGDWRVPPEFKGTINDNWTTRAIDRLDNSIPKIIKNNIEKNL